MFHEEVGEGKAEEGADDHREEDFVGEACPLDCVEVGVGGCCAKEAPDERVG